jgi:hypothetical protein
MWAFKLTIRSFRLCIFWHHVLTHMAN